MLFQYNVVVGVPTRRKRNRDHEDRRAAPSDRLISSSTDASTDSGDEEENTQSNSNVTD